MSRTYKGWNRRLASGCGVTGKTSFRSAVAARTFVASCLEQRLDADGALGATERQLIAALVMQLESNLA